MRKGELRCVECSLGVMGFGVGYMSLATPKTPSPLEVHLRHAEKLSYHHPHPLAPTLQLTPQVQEPEGGEKSLLKHFLRPVPHPWPLTALYMLILLKPWKVRSAYPKPPAHDQSAGVGGR